MEDENGIELSLGLSCCGSSGKANMRDGPPDPRVEGNCTANANISDVTFKNIFRDKQEEIDKQTNDRDLRTPEKFWTNLGKAPIADGSIDAQGNVSQFIRCEELWGSNVRNADTEEEVLAPTKRKLPFEGIGSQQQKNRVADLSDSLGKSSSASNTPVKHSRISATTEDCSIAENEEVAESQVEGLNSWLIAQHDDNTKGSETYDFTGKQDLTKPNRKLPIIHGNESNQEQGKTAYGIPLSLQQLPGISVPYPVPLKAPIMATAPHVTMLPSPCVMQLMPTGNKERPAFPNMNSNSSQFAFGYSSMQLPTLETGPTWALGSQSHHMTSFSFSGHCDGVPNSERVGNVASMSHASVPTPHSSMSELINGGRKQSGDVGTSTSSQADECKGSSTAFVSKELACQPLVDGLAQRNPVIRPGLAPHVKFGGSGSYPDLPWVSATGSGPHGRTVSGVTYKYNEDHVKIVCACHGTHMTPDEFVQHASEDDAPNQDDTSIPSSKPAASAQI